MRADLLVIYIYIKRNLLYTGDPRRIDHLLAFDGAKERLHLFKANLLEEGSFDSVVDGCEAVFHTASPVSLEASNPKEELIEPAVKGTINVLKSCVKVGCVKRVILTSSIVTIFLNEKYLEPNAVVDETWYSDPKYCEQKKSWYEVGKTLAEKAAWEIANENAIDLVTLHPAFMIGLMLQPTRNYSIKFLLNLLKGETYPNGNHGIVDVRDVADAHIKALENPLASGRYILAADTANFTEVLRIICGEFPNMKLPERCDENTKNTPTHVISNEKSMSLRVSYMPMEVCLRDTILCLAERGLLNI